MVNHDYLSQRTRSFRKGVLTFSAFLVLAISYDIKVTKIPALGIEDINPNIVFSGNLIALIYLFASYIIYYLQDRVHHDSSELALALKTKEMDRTNKYLQQVKEYVDNYFKESIKSVEDNEYELKTKGYILRALMKDHLDDESSKKSIEAIINSFNEQNGTNLSPNKISNELSNERYNYISAKEKGLKLVANQVTADSLVSVWDFWLPVASTVLAVFIFKIKF